MPSHRVALTAAGLVAVAVAAGLSGCGRTVVARSTVTPVPTSTSAASVTPELTPSPEDTDTSSSSPVPEDSSPGVTVSGSDGTVVVGPGAELPSDWPAAVPPRQGSPSPAR